ncbi:TRAP transporter small permease subunit [Pseudovibrio sp. Tun.PSC04-5.I4]|uniref:TRAP transporter small permease n=1 Tax=Pseudovibrio sp. Tun.PSC04-5.I4 TaxID=1798213 RepID=UPI0008872AB7|nr:TRAP transporter small permease subunit [Pseudovibrio sp. Tun.PSC04-5.I4]SDR48067.1 Tripartite ATP-independent transporter, DctQ component [Pseudovibrio sp. Tun.PSC04-5.I4]
MKSFLSTVVTILGKIEMAACMALITLIVSTISFQIILRYVFDSPIAWMEEVVTIAFIILTMLAAAVATKEKRHILVDLFPRGPVARTLGVMMAIVTILTLAAILLNIMPVLTVELRRNTISLPFNFPVAFYNSIPLIYCFSSIILSIVYDVIFERKDEQEALV